MKLILTDSNKYIIRIDRGDELISVLTEFCSETSINTAFFWGIGACNELELGWYDVDSKKYTDKLVTEKLEIISLQGNIARMNGKTIVHSHGSFSNQSMNLIGGHVKKMRVAATCEILLAKIEGEIKREYSEEIGLNLMS